MTKNESKLAVEIPPRGRAMNSLLPNEPKSSSRKPEYAYRIAAAAAAIFLLLTWLTA